MQRVTVLLAAVVALAGCESRAEKDRKAKAEYASYTAEACSNAKSNVVMVESTRAAMNKPERYEGGRSFAKTVCDEAEKAALAGKR